MSSSPQRSSEGSTPRTITKKELVARIAEKTNQTKVVAKDIIQMFLDEIIRELGDGNRLEFREFGVFEIKERAARKAQNPRTLEKVHVPAKRVVKFKVGRLMKESVSRPPPAPEAPPAGGEPGAQAGGRHDGTGRDGTGQGDPGHGSSGPGSSGHGSHGQQGGGLTGS